MVTMLSRAEQALYSPIQVLSESMLEEESSSAASYIFSELVPVRIKIAARDDYTATLTVRLKPDNASHPRSLLLELTDENDLFFYHSLVLGEGEFQVLKAEQRLLVDFQGFPAKLMELLGRCMEPQGTTVPTKMAAMLDCGPGGESVLSIVESNHFRELTHLALRLRAGSDEVVKQHLAGKLRSMRVENSELSERLRSTDEALLSSKKQNDELAARARVVSEERSHLERSLTQTHQRELVELKEERSRTLQEQQQQACEERARLEAELQLAVTQAQERLRVVEARADDLQQKLQAESTSAKTYRERLAASESQLADTTAESKSLKEQVKQLEREKFQHEREITELRERKSSLEEKVASNERLALNQSALHEQVASQRSSLEEDLKACKQQVKLLEEKFGVAEQEIIKGNQVIQSLETKLKQAKAKVKLKSAEVSQQEKAKQDLERAGDATKHLVEEKAKELAHAVEREQQLKRALEEKQQQLDESHTRVEKNQETIEFLNRELTAQRSRELPPASMASLMAARKPIAPSIPLSAPGMEALRKLEGTDFGTPNYLASPLPTKSLVSGSGAFGVGGPMSSVSWKA